MQAGRWGGDCGSASQGDWTGGSKSQHHLVLKMKFHKEALNTFSSHRARLYGEQELGGWEGGESDCHLKGPAASLTWFSELAATAKSKTRIQKNPLIWVPCWQPKQNSPLDVLPTPGGNTVLLPDRNCMSCPKATPLKGSHHLRTTSKQNHQISKVSGVLKPPP